MYVRVKRSKTTIFLHVEPTDTILELKQKLQELTQQAHCFVGAKVANNPFATLKTSRCAAGTRNSAFVPWSEYARRCKAVS